MSDPDPLLVPVQVQAMVLNNPAVNFIRAKMNYTNLADYLSPSPGPFQQDDDNYAGDPANHGVYLMWTLPQALRHGTQNAAGALDFPFVPNRWLVVRVYRPGGGSLTQTPQAQAWIVQSDALGSSEGTPYLDPRASTLSQVLLGNKVSLSASAPWQEPGNTVPYFLKAVTESNLAFAAYQPFNQNVFSLLDDLVTQNVGAGTLSYFVFGWYADASADILADWVAGAKGNDFSDVLTRLKWAVTETTETTHTSLYTGGVFAIPWDPNGPPPPSPKDGAQPQVAVGNTSVDAVVAFMQAALAASSQPLPNLTPQEATDLLEAFQYNLLQMLSLPGAEAMLEQAIRSQWFGSARAGTSWVIVDAEALPGAPPPTPPPATELAAEATWLAALNTAQTQFDQTLRELLGVQRRLFELWWKQGAANAYYNDVFSYPWGVSPAQFQQALDPTDSNGPPAQARALIEKLNTLAQQIPIATEQVSLDQAIANFAQSKNLPASRVLKAVAPPRFWQSADPVFVISGTAHSMRIDPDSTLACRWPDELVSGLKVTAGPKGPSFTITSQQLDQYLPAAPWTNLPAAAAALFQEFFLLDPANAPLVAAGQNLSVDQLTALAASMSSPQPTAGQTPAVLPPYPWVQPWQPLYLDWEIQWYPIPFQAENGAANWAFNGLDYDLVTGFTSLPGWLIDGRSLLTPKPSFEFKARLDQFIADNPNSPATQQLRALENLIQNVDQWDFLSQALSGLSTQLAWWSPTPVQNPDATTPVFKDSPLTLADLIGDLVQSPPQSRLVQQPPRGKAPPSDFEALRGGQFYINRLTIVDVFGQTLEIVLAPTPPDQIPRTFSGGVFHPLVADGLAPTQPVQSIEPLRFVQLPPRLLQPGRLNFQFAPATNGNPVVGWVLPNHLDAGLAVYGPDGTAYGELHPALDTTGNPFVDWAAAPNSPYTDLEALASAQSQLGGFLSNLKAAGPGAFANFLQAVDETLWTVDPLGNRSDTYLSVLLGRPLAVVTASLSLELQSTAYWDPGWPYTFDPPQPLFLNGRFPVRLGDLGYRQDGLLGYFVDGNYTHFNTIHQPDVLDPDPKNYLKLIEPGNYINCAFADAGPGTPVSLTLLMDPRGSVHAQCALFPVKEVTLLSAWVDDSLKAMNVIFRTGPALVDQQLIVPTGQTQAVAALLLPSPAERHGTWSWVELQSGGHWSADIPLAPVDESATFPDTPPTLREGLLKLSGGLDE